MPGFAITVLYGSGYTHISFLSGLPPARTLLHCLLLSLSLLLLPAHNAAAAWMPRARAHDTLAGTIITIANCYAI